MKLRAGRQLLHRWVNMNALTVLSVVALVACSSSQLLGYGYPGYGHPGFYGYPDLFRGAAPIIQRASPITLKTVAAAPVPTVSGLSPVAYNTVPFAPVAPIQTQYHAQDEIGQYSFGYAGGPSSRSEHRNAFGGVTGVYNYVDSDGQVQTVNYVADAFGFRVAGTNLPVAPEAPAAAPLVAPEPVEDTPEVAAAKAAHQAVFAEASAAPAEETAPARKKRAIVAAAPGVAPFSPLRFSYGFSPPLTYSLPAVTGAPLQYTSAFGLPAAYRHYAAAAPALTAYAGVAPALTTYAAGAPVVGTYAASVTPRDATLLRVENNPGHATSYRLD